MNAYTLKVKALFVVGSSNEIIERLSRQLSVLAEKHGGKVVEPDPFAIMSYVRWYVNLVDNEQSLEREIGKFAGKYPGVLFVLEKSKATA